VQCALSSVASEAALCAQCSNAAADGCQSDCQLRGTGVALMAGSARVPTIVGFEFCGLPSQQTLVASQGNDRVQQRITTCDGS
jgi:hypothetical protein